MAQLKLKHERYKQAAALGDADGIEVESLLAKMERRTKVRAVMAGVVVTVRVEVEVESMLARTGLRTKARGASGWLYLTARYPILRHVILSGPGLVNILMHLKYCTTACCMSMFLQQKRRVQWTHGTCFSVVSLSYGLT